MRERVRIESWDDTSKPARLNQAIEPATSATLKIGSNPATSHVPAHELQLTISLAIQPGEAVVADGQIGV